MDYEAMERLTDTRSSPAESAPEAPLQLHSIGCGFSSRLWLAEIRQPHGGDFVYSQHNRHTQHTTGLIVTSPCRLVSAALHRLVAGHVSLALRKPHNL